MGYEDEDVFTMADEDVFIMAFMIGYESELYGLPYDYDADLDQVVSEGYAEGRLAAGLDVMVVMFDYDDSDLLYLWLPVTGIDVESTRVPMQRC